MLTFSKYHGAGNDFILIEDFEETFSKDLVPKLCHRSLGIGSDGLILARHSERADFKMVYFNRDGSEAAFCGNGLRCFVHFLRDFGKIQKEYRIEIGQKILTVICEGSKIFTFLPIPDILMWEVKLEEHETYVVDAGVPHAVVFALDTVDVLQEGRALRLHEKLAPEGANVNFVKPLSQEKLQLRTYERGVELETLACGSGAASSAFVAHKLGLCGPKVEVITRSDEVLDIEVGKEIKVGGPSVKVFEGQIYE